MNAPRRPHPCLCPRGHQVLAGAFSDGRHPGAQPSLERPDARQVRFSIPSHGSGCLQSCDAECAKYRFKRNVGFRPIDKVQRMTELGRTSAGPQISRAADESTLLQIPVRPTRRMVPTRRWVVQNSLATLGQYTPVTSSFGDRKPQSDNTFLDSRNVFPDCNFLPQSSMWHTEPYVLGRSAFVSASR